MLQKTTTFQYKRMWEVEMATNNGDYLYFKPVFDISLEKYKSPRTSYVYSLLLIVVSYPFHIEF